MEIKGYSFKEVAGMYFPGSVSQSASVQLRRWIKLNKLLTEALAETGLVNRQRLLTPRQVELIFKHLGEP
ncbi:MAG: DUF4248 domain-containing protein [Parabacteroides merdae]